MNGNLHDSHIQIPQLFGSWHELYNANDSLGQTLGRGCKSDQSKNRSKWAELCPYKGIRSIFWSCFAHCHIQVYSNGWRRVHNGLMFFFLWRLENNLLEGFPTSIKLMSVKHFLRVDRRAFLSSSDIAHIFRPIDSKLMRNEMQEFSLIAIFTKD